MIKKFFLVIAVMALTATADMVATSAGFTGNTCAAATYDRNSDGYIYKGTITLTRVASDGRNVSTSSTKVEWIMSPHQRVGLITDLHDV